MITDSHVEIDAPAAAVWAVFADVEHWSEWTASIERIVPLDGAGLAAGRRYEIKQPRLPVLVWEVTDLEPGVSWTWVQRSPGSRTSARHEVVALDARAAGSGQATRTLVRQRIDQRGPLGVATGVVMRRLTRRYLALEAQGLKARSEGR